MKTAVGVIAGTVLGLLAGYAAFHSEPPELAAPQPGAVCPDCPACEAPSTIVKTVEKVVPVDSGTTAAEKCAYAEQSVASLSQVLQSMDARMAVMSAKLESYEKERVSREGMPVQKPANLDPRFEQQPMQKAIEAAIKEMDFVGADITSVDCSEYPCIIYGQGMGARGDLKKLGQAKALEPYAKDHGWGWGWNGAAGDGGNVNYFGMTYIPSKSLSEDEKKRLDFRFREMRTATTGRP